MSATGIKLRKTLVVKKACRMKNWTSCTQQVLHNGNRYSVGPRRSIFLRDGDTVIYTESNFEIEGNK